MKDIYSLVASVLGANTRLIELLDGDRIYAMVAPKEDEFPRITFFEITNYDHAFSDDEAYQSRIVVQVDVWDKTYPRDIAVEVDKAMKQEGFIRTSSADLYEEDTRIFHKGLRYFIDIGG